MPGRNAAQLRAAATATGWFDGPYLVYQGDGYSVPWQTGTVVSPAFGGLMWVYKAHLDAICPQGARLHDWLYTPYGPNLIGADQEEADLALREDLMEVSPADAEIVYQAVSKFGAPYFGVSPVGYSEPALTPTTPNITPTTPGSLKMADWKVVMIFQQTTTKGDPQPSINYASLTRVGGWSESFYVANKTGDELRNMLTATPRKDGAFPPILPARASCLTAAATLLGVRLYEGGTGRGQFVALSYPGRFSFPDQPGTSLLCQTVSNAALSARHFTMRGIPDAYVVGGEFNPNSEYVTQLKTYFDSLTNTAFRAFTPTAVFNIFNITNAGLVSLTAPHTYNVGQIVRVKNSLNEAGGRSGGEFMIQTVGPLNTQFTLAGWAAGPTTGGTVTIQVKQLVTVSAGATSAVRITNHKVGRPFAGYRGRRSKRTRTA